MIIRILISILLLSNMSFAGSALERPPQFVLVSFDGSKSSSFWQESFKLAKENNAQFSYFISGVYFLQKKDRLNYLPPSKNPGASDIGFSENKLTAIQKRTANVWYAMKGMQKPMEIGSHVNGHFDGSFWTYEEWIQEFSEFHRLVSKVFSFYPTLEAPYKNEWEDTINTVVKGFRAPLLAGQPTTTAAVMTEFKYTYDASQVLKDKWPYKHTPDLWNIGLARISLHGSTKETIAMDYNILYGQCNGQFNPSNSGQCKELDENLLEYYEKQTYLSYVRAFLKNYYGNRAPISIGHHFSLWNKGIYWKALQNFVIDICQLPEVQCVSHIQLVNWLEAQNKTFGYSIFNKLNQGLFSRTNTPSLPLEVLEIDFDPLRKVGIRRQIKIPEISENSEKVMLNGDHPAAHKEIAEDVNLKLFRVKKKFSKKSIQI